MRYALAFLMLLSNPSHAAAPLTPDLRLQVDRIAREWLAATRAPSASIAVVLNGELAYAQAYGSARLDPRRPATPRTRYSIDSISKEFTAAAVLMLAEDGKLQLDDALRRWFPDLGEAGGVTLREALTHTGGLRDFWPQDFVTPEMSHPAGVDQIIGEWARRPLDFPPGSEWQYSNTGYVLAGRAVELSSGTTLVDYLQARIFAPLQMADVADYDAGPLAAGDAGPYTRYGTGPVRPAPKEAQGWLFGAAQLALAPTALAAWDRSLLRRSLLRAESYSAELSTAVLKDGTDTHYGLGLDIGLGLGRRSIGHDGSGSGFLSANRLFPDDQAAIIVFTNNDWASPDELVARLAFALLPPATAAEARARRVFAGLQSGSVDRAAFSAVGNFYLTTSVLQDLHASLAPLGPARRMELEQESRRGGMVTRRWKILCARGRLEAIERGQPDGSLDEFFVNPRTD